MADQDGRHDAFVLWFRNNAAISTIILLLIVITVCQLMILSRIGDIDLPPQCGTDTACHVELSENSLNEISNRVTRAMRR